MGVNNFLVCMDCKDGLDLGKAIHVTYPRYNIESYGFEELGTSKYINRNLLENFAEELQHFLMLHRCHELRVLPGTVEKYAKVLGFPHSFPMEDDDPPPDNRKDYFMRKVEKPDPHKEADNLPEELIKKLEEF